MLSIVILYADALTINAYLQGALPRLFSFYFFFDLKYQKTLNNEMHGSALYFSFFFTPMAIGGPTKKEKHNILAIFAFRYSKRKSFLAPIDRKNAFIKI